MEHSMHLLLKQNGKKPYGISRTAQLFICAFFWRQVLQAVFLQTGVWAAASDRLDGAGRLELSISDLRQSDPPDAL